MKSLKITILSVVLLTITYFNSSAQLSPQAGFQSPVITSSGLVNTNIQIYDPNASGGLLVRSSGDRNGYDYSIAARYISSGSGASGVNYDGFNSALTPNSDYNFWSGIRSVVNGDGPDDVRAADFRMNMTNGNGYDVDDQIIFAFAGNNTGNLTGMRLINNSTGDDSRGMWITHSGGDFAIHATGTDNGAFISSNDLGLQVEGRVRFTGGVGNHDRVQIGEGLSSIGMGSAYGSALHWGTSYIGFNALRVGSNWEFNDDGANNGGAVIYGNVGGDIYFTTETSTGGFDKTVTDQDMGNQVKMVLKGEGRLGVGTRQTPTTFGTANIADYRLFVAGGILTEEVRVETGWADYVFEEDYELPSLETVKNFIAQEGHLIGVPSAHEVENNGLELGNIAVKQQEKIEELFLYMIELHEAVKVLQAENAALKATLEK